MNSNLCLKLLKEMKVRSERFKGEEGERGVKITFCLAVGLIKVDFVTTFKAYCVRFEIIVPKKHCAKPPYKTRDELKFKKTMM